MKKTIFVLTILICPFPAMADLVPRLNDDPVHCPDRPKRPQWVENIDVKDAHKGVLVQKMYRAQRFERVANSGDCSCGSLYPAWDDAEAYYLNNYMGLSRHEILDKTSEYLRIGNDYRPAAKEICQKQGNW